MGFREVQSRIRKGHAAANLAIVRHAFLNALQSVKGKRDGIKRLKAQSQLEANLLVRTTLEAMI